jgi:hypothetical protein
MQRSVLGVLAVLMLSAAGCGSSTSNSAVCDNVASALNGLATKYQQCGTIPTNTFDKNQCVNGFNNSSCTDADKTKINNYVACLNNLPTCTVATQSTWVTSFSNCASQLTGLSNGC